MKFESNMNRWREFSSQLHKKEQSVLEVQNALIRLILERLDPKGLGDNVHWKLTDDGNVSTHNNDDSINDEMRYESSTNTNFMSLRSLSSQIPNSSLGHMNSNEHISPKISFNISLLNNDLSAERRSGIVENWFRLNFGVIFNFLGP